MLALRLPKEVEDRLDDPARKTGRTKSYYAREAILEHLDDLEDLYLAEQRMQENPQFVSFDEIVQRLDINLAKPDEA